MDISAILRREVAGFEPYLPGKPIAEVKRELGLKKVVKLASNENAIGTSKKVIAALRRSPDGFFRYPEGPGTLLRHALAKHLNVEPKEVILGAGSDELIELLGKTFFNREDEVIVSEHAFIRYKMAADLMGTRSVIVPMKDNTHDLEAMARAVTPRTKAIFIANPNNPTGTYVGAAGVKRFFDALSRLDAKARERIFVVFDEAYYEFARALAPDYPETLAWCGKGFNLVVLRTFSKIYGLAGLRVGYGVAEPDVVAALDRVRPPFNVSSVAQNAALAALQDAAHLKKSVAVVKAGLKYLRGELEALSFKVLPTAGNFLMFGRKEIVGRELFSKLLRKGVIVRTLDEYGFPNDLRVTVGRPEENRFFIQKLKEVAGRQ